DFFLDRLVKRTNKLRNDMALYESQCKQQSEETDNNRSMLQEAVLQMAIINQEKKMIQMNWNNSLLGMKKRDEAYSASLDAFRQLQEQLAFLKKDLSGYKKAIMEEQHNNERLTQAQTKSQREVDSIREQLNWTLHKFDELRTNYSTFSRLLKETEENLMKTTAVKSGICDGLAKLQKEYEKKMNDIRNLERCMMDKVNNKLMMEKSVEYVTRLATQNRAYMDTLLASKISVENEYCQIMLGMASIRSQRKHFEELFQEHEAEIAKKNKVIDHCETEIHRRDILVNRKQNTVDICQKKLAELINKAGGMELGPLDSTIRAMHYSLAQREDEIIQQQQIWLHQQRELVTATMQRDKQVDKINTYAKQFVILTQKKLRTDGKIDRQKSTRTELERSMKNCLNTVVKLNGLIHKELNLAEDTGHNVSMMEKDFILTLQEEKSNLVELQTKLEQVKEEKEELLQRILETDQDIMLLERKIQLLKETRSAVDADFQQGEISSMKTEIHRMEMRYSQLMKHQNTMIQDTERFLLRRDNIDTLGEVKDARKTLTKGRLTSIINDTKRKIRSTQKETARLNQELESLLGEQNKYTESIEVVEETCNEYCATLEYIRGQVKRCMNTKYKKLSDLVLEQRHTKYYDQLKQNRYKMLCATKEAHRAERTRQLDRVASLNVILEQLLQQYPAAHPALERLVSALQECREAYAAGPESEGSPDSVGTSQ
ncbi:coiled-coil domain-containing protein 40-like, partial [Argonauta hians]